jgi:hypothetical protein
MQTLVGKAEAAVSSDDDVIQQANPDDPAGVLEPGGDRTIFERINWKRACAGMYQCGYSLYLWRHSSASLHASHSKFGMNRAIMRAGRRKPAGPDENH